jgi:hypothetical protein
MQKDILVFDKLWTDKILSFIKSPITALIFGILLSTFFYFLSKSFKNPFYYYTNPELIAKKTNNNLKILYNDIEYTNIFLTNLIIWNDGDDYIDYSDFISNKPIKIYSPERIKILSISIDKKSRSGLSFETYIINDTINIRLVNEEAIEHSDGAKFLILFSKVESNDNITKFELSSRIKGTKNGFIYKNLNNFETKNNKFSIYFLWITIILLLAFRIITLIIYKKPIVFRKFELVFIVFLFFITVYMTINYIFFTTSLNWL